MDSRRLHFKKNTREFCFETLTTFCPVSGKGFYIRRDFLEEHGHSYRTAADCFCNECSMFLYKEGKKRVKRGAPISLGKSV